MEGRLLYAALKDTSKDEVDNVVFVSDLSNARYWARSVVLEVAKLYPGRICTMDPVRAHRDLRLNLRLPLPAPSHIKPSSIPTYAGQARVSACAATVRTFPLFVAITDLKSNYAKFWNRRRYATMRSSSLAV